MALRTPLRTLGEGSATPLPHTRLVRGCGQRSGLLGVLLPRELTHEGVVLEQHIREGRFQRSLALIAGMSALLGGLEVAYEHYRGSYGQRIMCTIRWRAARRRGRRGRYR
jgi:hypothetical protein